MVHLIPSWLVWAEVKCSVHVALQKWPINQFKPVKQSKKQELRAYCLNIYFLLTWQVVLRLSPSNFMPSTHLKLTTSPKSWTSLFMDGTAIFDPQIRRQMSLGTYSKYEKSILGCVLDCEKKGLGRL